MTRRTTHISITIRGDSVWTGITVSNGQVPFSPRWGLTRHDNGLLACTPAPDGELEKIHVAIINGSVVLVPCDDEPSRELVLVQQYSPGSGRKRWPSFHVELGPEVRQLSSVSTSGGSGGEHWVLISASLGWVDNIASQFIDERDYGGQVVGYVAEVHFGKSESSEQNGGMATLGNLCRKWGSH
jgi:hypothetical protein